MHIAIVGGTGFIGTAIVRAAATAGHQVRAVVRHAPGSDQVSRDPALADVEYHLADISDVPALRGAFDGVEVVVHAAGIAREVPPHQTFTSVNVEGTRHIIAECQRARSPRLVFLSSLGAERGSSAYHRSKRYAEMLVREYGGDWCVLRPGNVYGPGSGEIALLMRLMRTLPVIPVVGDPDTPFQPVFLEDLAEATLRACSRRELSSRTLEIAGDDITSQRDLISRLRGILYRRPVMLRVPTSLALGAARILQAAGVQPPIWRDQLTMVREKNVLLNRKHNALRDVLGVQPRPLDSGLRELARSTPEQFANVGSGRVTLRKYWVDIAGSSWTPAELMKVLRREFADLMPDSFTDVAAEDVSDERLVRGATISLALPVRGHVQVRVEEVTPYAVTCVTLEGHPLAGVVRYLSEQRGNNVRFEVQTIDRPRTSIDRVMMAAVGTHLKHATWQTLLRNVVERSGGTAQEPHGFEETALDEEKSKRFQQWMHELVTNRIERQGYSLHDQPIAS